MLHRLNLLRVWLGGVLFLAAAATASAAVTDPQPGDVVAPPINVNIGFAYNYFSDTGRYGEAHGGTISNNTHLADDVVVARYIRTFAVAGYTSGVQVYAPFVTFLGAQQIGVRNIPGPAPGFPSFGPGRAALNAQSGFTQPNFSAFFFPINNPDTGTWAVVSPWISPPISSFNKNKALNPGTENAWDYELETGFRTTLFGTPKTRNLSIELWNSLYFFGNNTNSALITPPVSADSIPPIYQALGITNPLQNATNTPATFREQPSDEVRVYLPYEIDPAIGAFITPGFYQSFGGKQTYKIKGFGVVDSGARTNETQIRLYGSTFLSPSLEVLLGGYYGIAAHGGPLDRTVVFRVAKFF